MWIDDDIMVRLISHLKRIKPVSYGPKDTHFSAGSVEKDRGAAKNVAFYTLEIYMPTLVFGTIMDSWLCSDEDPLGYLAKFDSERIAQDGIFVAAIKEVVALGRLPADARLEDIRARLEERALSRIREVYHQFRHLQSDRGHSFASLWATGAIQSHDVLGQFCQSETGPEKEGCRMLTVGKGLVKPEWHKHAGVSSHVKLHELPTLGFENLNSYFAQELEKLIDDIMSYLQWILVSVHYLRK